MKRIFTLLFACGAFLMTAMAQGQHGPMKFVGNSSYTVAGVSGILGSDTIMYQAAGQTTADITIPSMSYSMGQTVQTIPSFVIHGATFSMDMATMTATFADQTFNETITVNGEEKTITGTSLVAAYKHDSYNTFTLTITFTYGRMPLPITYSIEAYYIKAYTNKMSVMIDKEYTVENVTFNVRTYPEGDTALAEDVTRLDVEVPTFDLPDATIGALTSGGYTVKGLKYDESKGGYYRDYSSDGLMLHFHTAAIDGDYPLSNHNSNDILVKFNGKEIVIVNNYQPGAMPFVITTTFPKDASLAAVKGVKTINQDDNEAPVYNLSGQRTTNRSKGIFVKGGKKYIK